MKITSRQKKVVVCGIGANEYNRISACETAKEIWDYLQTSREGTKWVKELKDDMLTTQYENLVMKEGETIFEMKSTLVPEEPPSSPIWSR